MKIAVEGDDWSVSDPTTKGLVNDSFSLENAGL